MCALLASVIEMHHAYAPYALARRNWRYAPCTYVSGNDRMPYCSPYIQHRIRTLYGPDTLCSYRIRILYSSDTLEQKADDAWSVTARHAATPTMCSVRVPHLPVGSKTAENTHAAIIARNNQCMDLELVCIIYCADGCNGLLCLMESFKYIHEYTQAGVCM